MSAVSSRLAVAAPCAARVAAAKSLCPHESPVKIGDLGRRLDRVEPLGARRVGLLRAAERADELRRGARCAGLILKLARRRGARAQGITDLLDVAVLPGSPRRGLRRIVAAAGAGGDYGDEDHEECAASQSHEVHSQARGLAKGDDRNRTGVNGFAGSATERSSAC